ncbi:MAG TPA: methyltransferase domain-containing protein [Nocardioidaceae bacterium]|nr:methyltransferase domain-containing protein [Nocardioidaceae bacterium]
MPASHHDRVEAAFTQQAGTFERADLNVAFTSGLPWLVELADPSETDRVLDVAGGTGLVARALAELVDSVTVVDTTSAMLDRGRQGALAEGYDNVAFVQSDALSLPFPAGAFHLVITRFSLHHFLNPAPLLDEIVRVTAPGGRIVVKDLVSSSDPTVAARQDEIERLRDDSHVSMPVEGRVATWLEQRGCQVGRVEQKSIDRPLQPWLDQSVTPDEQAGAVRSMLRAELAGGNATGMRPHVEEGALWFQQTWETTVARRQ